MSIRLAAATGYAALTALFLTAALHSGPEVATTSLSSISIGKTDRITTGSPEAFVTERFAG